MNINRYTRICLLLLACFSLTRLHAQSPTLVSCTPSYTTPGSNITVTITGANLDFMSGTTVAAEMRSPSGATYSSTNLNVVSSTVVSADFSIPGNAVLGDYDLRVQFTMGTYVPGLFSVVAGAPNAVGAIAGHLFFDANANCVQEVQEPDLYNYLLEFLPGPYYAATDAYGDYYAQLPPGTYAVSPAFRLHHAQTCPVGGPQSINIPAVGVTTTAQDFGIEMLHVTDGSVYCSTTQVRPGFNQDHTITVTNLGYYALTGTLEYVLDSNYDYLSSSPVGTVSGDTVRWNLGTPLNPGGTRNYHVTTNLPVSVPLNTVLTCQSRLLPDSTDANYEDNYTTCSETVVGSYDPNDKMVWNQDMVPADPVIQAGDSLLFYRIRFQNTGTASAINIFIRDTLDTDLDASTFQNLAASHYPYTFSMNGEGNMEWRFDNIDLPDSNTNEPASHGFILYSIKLKPGFGFANTIYNDAAIYFDFNSPVITNQTQTDLAVGRVEGTPETPVVVYPNPATQSFFVHTGCEGLGVMDLTLMDAFGKAVRTLKAPCNGGDVEVPVEDLSAGVYFLRMTVGDRAWTTKVVVMDH
jgi:uncharacterized repeat protein (TIGR01451 family)